MCWVLVLWCGFGVHALMHLQPFELQAAQLSHLAGNGLGGGGVGGGRRMRRCLQDPPPSSSSTSTNETDVAPATKSNAHGRVWGQGSTSRARQARRAAQFGSPSCSCPSCSKRACKSQSQRACKSQSQRACKSQSHRACKSQSQRWQAGRRWPWRPCKREEPCKREGSMEVVVA